MAKTYKGEGAYLDFPYIIQTGVTITAGSMVWVDVSGTNVVHPVRSYSGVSPESNATLPASGTGRGIASLDVTVSGISGMYIGVLARTQTGASDQSGGNATGVTIIKGGVFEFLTTPTASCNIRIGYPVHAIRWDTVGSLGTLSFADATGTNVTGAVPVGDAVFFPAAVHVSNVATRVHVRMYSSILSRGVI